MNEEQIVSLALGIIPPLLAAAGSAVAAYFAIKAQIKKGEHDSTVAKDAAVQQALEAADVSRMKREERLQQQLERRTKEQEQMIREQGELIEVSHLHTLQLREEIFALRVVSARLASALKQCLGEEGIPQDLRDALDGAGIKNY